ncbi:hypothetical protein NGI46_25735 [Peribacillus butanolivorans]|uniref:hypothetical protein n=1 Tax=Peribacillus butanolivorans TaxID=421767 RepID=UPI00207CE537|nr:hypothetical protein [Peribacillus butanolivorans]MCO0600730.1 hypothetical protein [Peribacillus butanolivorans]
MGFWANISILLLLATIVFIITGIVFLFMKNGKAKKVFKTSCITFLAFIVSLILSSDNGGLILLSQRYLLQ